MNKQEFTTYEAPEVEIVEVEVEQGFQMSGTGNDSDDSPLN